MTKEKQLFLNNLLNKAKEGNFRAVAKLLTAIENTEEGIKTVLENLGQNNDVQVIGITGPPGAGKSTLVSSLIGYWANDKNLKVAVLAVDPASPFNLGAILGDRLRMSEHYTNKNVFIRSVSSRGALGGLAHKVVEAADLLKVSGFDKVIIETVGVGQSEIEIAGLADTTVLVLVPEAGDDIQAVKSGIMEIADIFAVNKSDREGATKFQINIQNALNHRKESDWIPPIIPTIATQNTGIDKLSDAIEKHKKTPIDNQLKAALMTEKAWKLIAEKRMSNLPKNILLSEIKNHLGNGDFNLYKFVNEKAGI